MLEKVGEADDVEARNQGYVYRGMYGMCLRDFNLFGGALTHLYQCLPSVCEPASFLLVAFFSPFVPTVSCIGWYAKSYT